MMCLLKEYCTYYEEGNCQGTHDAYEAICQSTGMKQVVEEMLQVAGTAETAFLVGSEEQGLFH